MAKFTDRKGREWDLSLDLAIVRRVEKETGINLGIADESLFRTLAADLFALGGLLYSILKPQIEARKLSEDDFAAGLAGEALESAACALVEAMTDFFPPKKAAVMKAATAKLSAMTDAALTRATARIEALTDADVFGD